MFIICKINVTIPLFFRVVRVTRNLALEAISHIVRIGKRDITQRDETYLHTYSM